MLEQTKKPFFIKTVVVVFFLAALYTNIFGLMFANDSENSVKPPGNSGGGVSGLSSYVIEGAGSFFKSFADILQFSNEIEMAELEGLDYNELQALLNSAIVNLQDARQAYINLIMEADILPYNQEVIGKLLAFDYQGYQGKNNLNVSAFNAVIGFLKQGDVKGLYHKILADFEGMLQRLETVKEKTAANGFPEIPDLREVNQSYAACMLFGQYVAQVFSEIL